MKKLTGIVAISFMAGMFCFGIGERVADEVWATKTAHAAASPFSDGSCSQLRRASALIDDLLQNYGDGTTQMHYVYYLTRIDVLTNEHC